MSGATPISNSALSATLRDLRVRQRSRQPSEPADLLQKLLQYLPFIAILCVLPLLYAIFNMYYGNYCKHDELLLDLSSDLKMLRDEIRDLKVSLGV